MSEVSSRPKVRSVSCAELVTSAGAVLIGSIIAAAVKAFTEGARQKSTRPSQREFRTPPKQADAIEGVIGLAPRRAQMERKILQQLQNQNFAPLDALKVSTLMSLEATPYVVTRAQVQRPLKDLIAASDVPAAEKAQRALLNAVNAGHRQIFEQSLTVACSHAAMKAGFNQIEVAQGPLGCIRVIAMNPEGKALVTELDAGDAGRVPRIETELVGVCDDSCVAILDAFDRALEEEGVRSDPPGRRETGGVCELRAAREFVRTRVHRVPTGRFQTNPANVAEPRSQSAARRAQRLNTKGAQKQQ